jgi:hypothetical protein
MEAVEALDAREAMDAGEATDAWGLEEGREASVE